MAYFSYSKIATFEQCKHKYKLKYIDKIKVEFPFTVEGFMGSTVHEALEYAFQRRKSIIGNETISKEQLLDKYKEIWEKNYTDDVLIVRDTSSHYYNEGKRMLDNFYDDFFIGDNLETIELETKSFLKINEQDLYHIRIDRLAKKDKNIHIVDYKTTKNPKTKDQLKTDRQLMAYAKWAMDTYKKDIILDWNYLVNSTSISFRADKKLIESSIRDIKTQIKEIKKEKDYPFNISKLCNWCLYKPYCAAWNPEILKETKTKEEQVQKTLRSFLK